ncbi:MAG: GAF domain-containing protein [Terriglobia bacterium]
MPDINKLFEKAEKYLQKQKFESALETYQEINRYQPNDEEVVQNLGDLCLRLNRSSEGLRYQGQLVDLYIKKNDVTKAVATCRKILKVSSQDVNTMMKLGALLEKTAKTAEALEVYRGALEQYRATGAATQILDCLQRIVKLDPNSLAAHVELGEQAVKGRLLKVATPAFLQAAQLARKAGQDDQWSELVERAHNLDPEDESASIAAAELYLKKDRAAEVVTLLEPVLQAKPDDLPVLDLLSRAYLQTKAYDKAQPVTWKLYQARPEALQLLVELAEGLAHSGKIDAALDLLKQIKGRLYQEGKRSDYLRIVEKFYEADETNLPVLEMLTGLYNDMNQEDGLRRSLSRLFGLYLAAEQYDQAADTLERIIDVDPYGAGHYDRLLTLEGHIDKIWYDNIAARVQPPSTARSATAAAASTGGAPGAAKAEGLDDLIIEAEMYFQYQLDSKLKETLTKIHNLFPGAEEKNPRLAELYNNTGFMRGAGAAPAAAAEPHTQAPQPAQMPSASAQSLEELKKISEITANIYREGTPQGVMQVAVNEIGRALNASRCWGSLGTADRPPALTVEYCSPAAHASDVQAALRLHSVLMQQAATKPDGWMMEDVKQFQVFAPINSDIRALSIQSLLALPLMDQDQPTGLMLAEQCDRRRSWTPGEVILLQTIATQVVIAVNNAKLRRMARSIAGADETGLLPRSAYLGCLLTEAARAKELAKPLCVCLFEPENATALVKSLGDGGVQRYLQQITKALQSNLRQNDVAVRYSPYSIAIVLPDTPLPQGGLAVEKLRKLATQVGLDGIPAPNVCCAICEVPLGLRFDAVDGVTEVINRLETTLEQARREGGKRVVVSQFEG